MIAHPTPPERAHTRAYRWAVRRVRLAVAVMLRRLPRRAVAAILRTIADSVEADEADEAGDAEREEVSR